MWSESPQSVQNSQRIKSDYEGKVRVKWSVCYTEKDWRRNTFHSDIAGKFHKQLQRKGK